MKEIDGNVVPPVACEDFPIKTDPDADDRVALDKQRQVAYTDIVNAFKTYYVKKSEANHCYKKIFFYVIIGVLALIVLIFGAVSILLLLQSQRWESVAVVMSGGTVTIVTALLKLPKIIAEHLFPKGEDQVIVDLVKALKDVE